MFVNQQTRKKNITINNRNAEKFIFIFCGLFFVIYTNPLFAQSGLEGQIHTTIRDLVRIINVIIIGFIAWAGFLIAKGDGGGIERLLYGVIGLVVVNSAYMIINFFQ